MSVKYYFVFLLFGVVLFGCNSSSRERSKIPPSPVESETLRLTAAIDILTDAIKSNPSVPENYFKRATIYLKMSKAKEAYEDIDRADKLKPSTGKYVFVKALALRELGKYKEALAAAQSVEVLNFDKPELYTLLGDLLQQKNELVLAENYLAKSLSISPYEGETYYYRAMLRARKSDTLAAMLDLNRSIELKPEFMKSYVSLTNILKLRGKLDSALVLCNQAIGRFPENLDLKVEKGLIFQRAARYDSAVVMYEKILKLDNNRVDVNLYLGNIYFKWKSFGKAAENYANIMTKAPNTSKIAYYLGLCKEKVGAYTEAEAYYKMALEKEPNDYAVIAGVNRMDRLINGVVGDYAYSNKKLPNEKTLVVEEIPQKRLDTNKIKVTVIAPKKSVQIKADSSRRIKIY